MAHWVGLACWLRKFLTTSWVVSPLELAEGVLALVDPTLERLHWVLPLEGSLGVEISADRKVVGVLAVRLLGVGNGAVGAVEAGSLE